MFSRYSQLLALLLLVTLHSNLSFETGEELDFTSEKCKSGQMQSPINISPPNVVPERSIGHLIRQYKPANAILSSGQDVIRITWQGDAGFIELDRRINYAIDNVHWHAPSEHTINGIRYDLELHMVHLNKNPNVVNNITVIAHLYQFGSPDPFLSSLMDRIAQLSKTNPSMELGMVNPNSVINNGLSYYRYMGSLTTPPCTENVTWIIDSTINNVSREQVQILRKAFGDNGEGNARPLQPINNRNILLGPFSQY